MGIIEEQYKQILDKSLGEHIQGWDKLSPMDPMKLFAEGLVGSFSDIEARQSRHANSVIDSLPSLFGVGIKQAQAPRAYFQVEPSSKVRSIQEINAGTQFRFDTAESPIYAQLDSSTIIRPIVEFSSQAQENRIVVQYKDKAACSGFSLFFVPGKKETTQSLEHIKVSVTQAGSSNVQVFNEHELQVFNNTNDFTVPERIDFKFPQDHTIPNAANYEIEFTFTSTTAHGQFYTNLVEAEYFFIEEQFNLGKIDGLPWEEVFLPNEIFKIPAALEIQLPNDQTVPIHRIDTDLLKLKHTNPDRFRHAFYYNGVNHSLVIPASNEIINSFLGGAKLNASQIAMLPDAVKFPTQSSAALGDEVAQFNSITYLTNKHGVVPQENTEEYLTRFYGLIRNLNTNKSVRPSNLKFELKQSLLESDENIRCAEIFVDSTKNLIDIYLLGNVPKTGEDIRLSPKTLKKAAHLLNQIVPLNYQWQIRPFTVKTATFQMELGLKLEENRAGTVTEDLLEHRLDEILHNLLLPPPFGSLMEEQPRDLPLFLNSLISRLTSSRSDESQLCRSEIASFKSLLVEDESARYLNQITRATGVLLRPRLELESHIQVIDVFNHSQKYKELNSPLSLFEGVAP